MASVSFEDWLVYCFEQPDDADLERRACSMGPRLVTEHISRLGGAAKAIADRFSDGQLARGVWRIMGSEHQYFLDVADQRVPHDRQIAAYESIGMLYTDLFDRRCADHRKARTDEEPSSADLDEAVYMIWDMGSIEVCLIHPKRHPHLIGAALGVLETALLRCRRHACKRSALHGLGHCVASLGERATSLIDQYLALPYEPDDLREYAKDARADRIL